MGLRPHWHPYAEWPRGWDELERHLIDAHDVPLAQVDRLDADAARRLHREQHEPVRR